MRDSKLPEGRSHDSHATVPMVRNRHFRLRLSERISFLTEQCQQYGKLQVRATLLTVIEFESNILSLWNLPHNNGTLQLLYTTPFHDMLRAELAYFGLDPDALRPSDRLLRFRATNMRLLSLDPMSLVAYRTFLQHVAAHLERDSQEAYADSVDGDESLTEMKRAQFEWGGRTRQFECECMCVEVRKCCLCSEVSLQRAGRWTGKCTMCQSGNWAVATEDLAGDSDIVRDGAEANADQAGVHMYGAENHALPPPPLAGFASLTDSEQAMLSPILPYIRITQTSNTTRGRSYGHTFIAPQSVNELVRYLPRLPGEIRYATITDVGCSRVEWDINIPRVVYFMHAMSQQDVLAQVLTRHGVHLNGQECWARLQEWQQSTASVPRVRRSREADRIDSCAASQFEDDNVTEDEQAPPSYADSFGSQAAQGMNVNDPEQVERHLYTTADSLDEPSGLADTLRCAIRNLDGTDIADIQCQIRGEGRVSDSHPDFFNLCFPYLNFGSCDYYFSLFGRDVAFNSKARWLRHMLLADGRFAAHKMFAFVAQNWVHRAVVNSSATVYLRRNSVAASKSISEIQEDVEQGDYRLAQDVFAWSKSITGSVPYWRYIRGRVKDFVNWKWYSTVPENERQLHPNVVRFPDLPTDEDLDFDLTSEELGLISAEVPESLVLRAAASERMWSRLNDEYVENTAKALTVFAAPFSEIAALVYSPADWTEWLFHTVYYAMKCKIYDTTLDMKQRATAALWLCRFTFLQDVRDIEACQIQWILDFLVTADTGGLDEVLQPFLGTTYAPELSSEDLRGAYLHHVYNYAQIFRERTRQFMASANPSFFFTGSMAEQHWPDLWRVMHDFVKLQSPAGDEWLTRVQADGFSNSKDKATALNRYPHISTAFFRVRTELLFDIILTPTLGIDDHILRYEFADGRGEIHWHGLLWSRMFPVGACLDRGDLSGIVSFARTWLRLSAVHPSSDASRHRYDEHSNPEGDKRDWHGPGHPCKQLFMCLPAHEVREWDTRMCNCCFHHGCRINDYCLRDCRGRNGPHYTSHGAPGDRRHTCRFGFHANDWKGKSSVQPCDAGLKPLGDGATLELVMERNSARLVQHSRFMRRAWKANCDTSLIVDGNPARVTSYVVGYIMKEGNATKEYHAAFRSMVSGGAVGDTATLIRKLMMTVLGHRDKPAQEVLYVATGQPLYRMSTPPGQLVTVSQLRRVVNADGKLGSNIVDRYVKDGAGDRGVSLYEFCRAQKKGFVCLTGERTETRWPLSESYCQMMLTLHMPWKESTDTLRCSWNREMSYQSHRRKFLSDFLFTEACPRLLFTQVAFAKMVADRPELGLRQHFSVKNAGKGQVAQFLRAFGNRSHDTDLNHDHVGCVSYPKAPPGYDWSDIRNWDSHDQCRLGQEELVRMAAYDEDAPDAVHDLDALHPLSDRTLSDPDQVAVLGLAMSHLWECYTRPVDAVQRRVVLQGAGGAGKSYVVRVIRAAVQAMTGDANSAFILAPTGAAASVIEGETIHRGLAIGTDLEFLDGAKAAAAARRVSNVKVLVFDEMSMIDQVMLSKSERRVCGLRGTAHGTWGQVWLVILCGDFFQLPPVMGLPLYATTRSPNAEQRRGQILYRDFDHAIVMTGNQRADTGDDLLRNCLRGLRAGEVSSSLLDSINSRCISGLDVTDANRFRQHSTMHFVAYNAERIQRNVDHLQYVIGPVAEIVSQDRGNRRHTEAPDSPSYFSGQQKILWLGAGVRVTLCRNIRTSIGLTKGRCGTVVHVQYAEGNSPPSLPLYVLVRMDVDVDASLAQKASGDPTDRNVIPIAPRRVQCQSGCCSRLQLPLELCSGMTVHKSQGSTVVQPTMISLGAAAEQRWPGVLYTALSRFSRLAMVAIEHPLSKDMLVRASRGLETSGRAPELGRLQRQDRDTRARSRPVMTAAVVRQAVQRCMDFVRHRQTPDSA